MKVRFPPVSLILLVLLSLTAVSNPAGVRAGTLQVFQDEASKGTPGGPPEEAGVKTRRGFWFGQSLGFAVNPLGLMLSSRLEYRLPLVEKPGILWETTRLEFGVANDLTPAFDELGGFVTVEPIAFFDVKLSCSLRAFYPIFGFGFYTVGSYGAEYEPREKGRDIGRIGCRFSAAPTLKFAFGRLVAADSFVFEWIDMASLGPSIPENFYVEPVSNAVMKLRDYSLTNNAYLMYKAGELIFTGTDRALLVGINHYFFTVPRSGYRSSRISLVGSFTTPLRKGIDLTSVLMIGVFLEDRYYSIEEGKIYAAARAAIDVRL